MTQYEVYFRGRGGNYCGIGLKVKNKPGYFNYYRDCQSDDMVASELGLTTRRYRKILAEDFQGKRTSKGVAFKYALGYGPCPEAFKAKEWVESLCVCLTLVGEKTE